MAADRKSTLGIRFFREEGSGNEPVRKWLRSLNKGAQKVIGSDIKAVQMCWPLGMPLVRSLGTGLWEIRSRIPNGIARVIFIIKSGEMILLHGFIKKTQRAPIQELDLAKKRAKCLKNPLKN